MTATNPRDMTSEEFAAIIGVSDRTVRRYIAGNQLRAFNVGVKRTQGKKPRVRWRITWAEAERFRAGRPKRA